MGTVLKRKGSGVWSMTPGQTVYEAIEMMANKGVGALLVMTGEKVAGIISERDYARKVILAGAVIEVYGDSRHHDQPGNLRVTSNGGG